MHIHTRMWCGFLEQLSLQTHSCALGLCRFSRSFQYMCMYSKLDSKVLLGEVSLHWSQCQKELKWQLVHAIFRSPLWLPVWSHYHTVKTFFFLLIYWENTFLELIHQIWNRYWLYFQSLKITLARNLLHKEMMKNFGKILTSSISVFWRWSWFVIFSLNVTKSPGNL